MRHLDYKNWAEYLRDLISIYPVDKNYVLELGAGRGNVSKFLTKDFANFFISDSSFQMLSKSELTVNQCICSMTSLPFKREFDVIFSIFDSVNYLLTPKSFIEFLRECNTCLSSNGILTFDISLERNSKANIRGLNRKGSFEGIRFKQISNYDEKLRLHTNVLEMIINDVHVIEKHVQRIYKYEDYFDFAQKADLKVLDAFDCFTFDNVTDKSERVQFVLGRI